MKNSRVPQALYESKISFSISALSDNGFNVKLGAEPACIDEATTTVFSEACQWLGESACRHYPDSAFAKEYRVSDDWLTPQALVYLIDHLVDESHRAWDAWHRWEAVDDAFEYYMRELHQTPQFWDATRRAFQDSVMLRLGRLFDPTRDALSIGNFLRAIRQKADKGTLDSLGVDGSAIKLVDIDIDLKAVSEGEQPIKKLLQIRNQYSSHRDAKLVASGTFEKLPKLTEEDLLTLLERAMDIVGKYSLLCRRRLLCYPRPEDHNVMFELLKAGLEARRA